MRMFINNNYDKNDDIVMMMMMMMMTTAHKKNVHAWNVMHISLIITLMK